LFGVILFTTSHVRTGFALRKLIIAAFISLICLSRPAYSLVSPNIQNLKNNASKIFKKSRFFRPNPTREKKIEKQPELGKNSADFYSTAFWKHRRKQ
jgi:hypothetical protein